MTKRKFFISYSRSVKNDVRLVVELLRAAGHDVWWDADIPKIEDWWATILKKIEWCDVFIFMASAKSVISPYCLEELKYAKARNRPILPFVLDDPTQYAMPPELGRGQWFIHDGDVIRLLHEINQDTANIDFARYQDTYAQRPPEPNKGTGSLNRQFQQAVDLAWNGHFDQAIYHFRDVGSLDPREWSEECQWWVARLQFYADIAEKADHIATLRRARKKWTDYLKEYDGGDGFDPLNVRIKIETPHPPTPSAASKQDASGEGESHASVDKFSVGADASLTISPAAKPRNPIEEAIERAWNFKGKHNADWTPFITTFPDFFIPDMPFCLVPVGEFMMGSDDGGDNEKPVHKQIITKPYWIAQHPVTNAQWRYVVEKSKDKLKVPGWSKWYEDKSKVSHPVAGVTWYQAHDFAELVGCQLPTELQWEYAARGLDNMIYPWGNEFKRNLCIYNDNSNYSTAAIGGRPKGASWIGAQDLGGNVWEWCSTIYNQYPYQSNNNYENTSSNDRRVLRGGSFNFTTENLRSADRLRYFPSNVFNLNGFRCARSIDGSDR